MLLNSEIQALPVVVIYNYLELFGEFLDRVGDADLIRMRKYADHDLFWLGDHKLTFASVPVEHATPVLARWGYPNTRLLCPKAPTYQLSLDILREQHLLDALIAYAGEERSIRLIPYAATAEFLQLVESLRSDHGLNIALPECPDPEDLWLRNFIDSKTGFRMLAPRWIPANVRLPFGAACYSPRQAAREAFWMKGHSSACIVKLNDAAGGVANVILDLEDFSSEAQILACLQQYPFLENNWLVVEEYIETTGGLSPSLEFYVPHPEDGAPRMTYVSNQFFTPSGMFAGVLVSKELEGTAWYPALAQSGRQIAFQLQALGYVGHFDLDTIVDDAGNLYLLEVNTRRTGGTYVHEFACAVMGSDYLDQAVLLGDTDICSAGVTDFELLIETIKDLLYPVHSRPASPYGVVVTLTSMLEKGTFGALFIAPTVEEVLTLRSEVEARLVSMNQMGNE